jgi:hypothetical protein
MTMSKVSRGRSDRDRVAAMKRKNLERVPALADDRCDPPRPLELGVRQHDDMLEFGGLPRRLGHASGVVAAVGVGKSRGRPAMIVA